MNFAKRKNSIRRYAGFLPAGLSLLLAACAVGVSADADANQSDDEIRWAAYGYIGNGNPSPGNRIGVYPDRIACNEAVEEWKSRQVAGTLVWGECLPVE